MLLNDFTDPTVPHGIEYLLIGPYGQITLEFSEEDFAESGYTVPRTVVTLTPYWDPGDSAITWVSGVHACCAYVDWLPAQFDNGDHVADPDF